MKLFNEKLAEVRATEYYNVDPKVAETFIESLTKHVYYVHEAAHTLEVPKAQIEVHDLSKLDPEEFIAYATHFHGNDKHDKYRDSEQFASAWLHHIHHNPHHWQHWMFPDSFEKGTVNGLVFMPEMYALEMVADWMGASMAYQSSWNMSEWLKEHIPKVHLHPTTAEFVKEILFRLGYSEDILALDFDCGGHECKCL